MIIKDIEFCTTYIDWALQGCLKALIYYSLLGDLIKLNLNQGIAYLRDSCEKAKKRFVIILLIWSILY